MTEKWIDCDYASCINGICLCEKTLDADGYADYCLKEECNQIEIGGVMRE